MKDKLRNLFISIIIVVSIVGLIVAWAFVVTDMIKSLAKNDDSVEPPVNVTYWTGESDKSWYDSENILEEYVLSTPEQFAGFSDLVNDDKVKFENVTIKLGADMYFNKSLDEAKALRPIGFVGSGAFFTGTFDGQFYSLNNLYMTHGDDKISGSALFGFVDTANLSNFSIRNIKVFGRTCVSAVVGMGSSVNMSDVNVTGAIIDSMYGCVGGMVGDLESGIVGSMSKIVNCSFDGYMSCQNGSKYAGGIVGLAQNCNLIIKNCKSNCIMKGFHNVAGIVGYISTISTKIEGNYVTIRADYSGLTSKKNYSTPWGGLVSYGSLKSDSVNYLKNNQMKAVINNACEALGITNVECVDAAEFSEGVTASQLDCENNVYSTTINVA